MVKKRTSSGGKKKAPVVAKDEDNLKDPSKDEVRAFKKNR